MAYDGAGVARLNCPPAVREVILSAAQTHDVFPTEITGPCRTQKVVRARDEVVLRLYFMTLSDGRPRFSLPQIGKFVGNRHHTTVLHSVRKYEAPPRA